MADECYSQCENKIDVCISTGPPGPKGGVGTQTQFIFYAQDGDTTVSGNDKSGNLMEVDPDGCLVSLNGVLLEPSADYQISPDGLTITFTDPIKNANNVVIVQTWESSQEAENAVLDLKVEVDKNTSDIAGLDVRVTQNESDIADLQADQTAQVVTTADVVTVGAAPFLDSKGDPVNQYEANWLIHDRIVASEGEIANTKQELQALDQDVSNLSQTVTDLATDVDGISISVATNTINISKNASDISQLQIDVGNITVPDLGPLDVRVTDLETLTTSHSSDLVDLRTDVDALGAPVDLGPLNNAISDNSVAIAKNASDIASIKAVDAQQSSQIGDLQVAVGNLEAIDHDHSNHAMINQDNVFTVSQTIKDGIRLTGSQAFIECDTGTALQIKNGNFSNSVVDIIRSNGDVAISLEASGHIRGVATDPNDGTCAANVDFVQQMTGTIDLTDYALQVDLDQEVADRIAGDKSLQDQVDALSASGGYNDAWIQPAIDAGDADLQFQIDALSAVGGYDDAWIQPAIDAGDAATLTGANAYTDTAIAGIVPPAPPDLSTYETIAKSESDDAALQSQIDALSASGGYNDAWIQPAIDAGDAATLTDANAYSDTLFAGVTHPDPPDLAPYETIAKSEADDADTLVAAKSYTDQELVPYETKQKSAADDAATLTSAKGYTDQKISAIVFPPGTIVKDTEPQNVPNGTNWFDTVRLELFVRASDSWLPSSPLGARVSQGEIVQAQILDRIEGLTTTDYVDGADEAVLNAAKKYTDESQGAEIAANVMVTAGDQDVESGWKLMSGGRTLISVGSTQVGLYHVKDPTDDAHPVTRGFADARYQFIQKPIGFKIDQSATCSLNPVPSSGEFCGLNNSSPGSSTSPNNYFGNFNAGIRVHADKLLNPEGNKFQVMERYSIAGTVSILGKDTGKLYFRHGIAAVVRESSHEYVELIFATRIPTFGTGAIDAEAKYIVIVDGLESVQPATANIPEETE